jgi:O-antigen ligase
MLAVTAGLALYVSVRTRTLWMRGAAMAMAVWATNVLLQTGSRAAAIALVAALIVVLVIVLRTSKLRRRQVFAGAAVLLALTALLLPRTSLYERLSGDQRFALNSVSGTTSARELAWRSVLTYVSESPERAAIGVGPGPDYLVASGARPYFGEVHRGDIRVPHNVLLTYYARLGAIGLVLFLALIASCARASWSRLAPRPPDELDITYVLLIVTLLLASLVGVILESPFGAVPFFWAVGQLLASRTNARSEEVATREAS